jgi:hypothetical protein
VHVQSTLPEFQLDYYVARFLDASVGAGERVLLLTPPLAEGAATRLYLEKAAETGSEEDLREAQRELQEVAAAPPDYERVVVYSRLGRDRLLAPAAACGEWVVVWNAYPDAARELAGADPVRVLRSGALSASILRRSCVR